MNENIIYCWWTGDNEMSYNRKNCLNQLIEKTKCNVILVTKNNIHKYILPDHPLHEAYQYLSETQKGDYLKAYFMNFYGGGYCDIKNQSCSWIDSFNKLSNSEKWIIGYKEGCPEHIAYKPVASYFYELIGNGAYICKPHTSLTEEWYNDMIKLLDIKLDMLRQFPSTFPQDHSEISNGKYPIGWNELNGRIFHRICYKYKDKLLNTLPMPNLTNYR